MSVAGPGVFEPPHADKATVADVEEVDLVDVHRASGGLEFVPGSLVRAGAAEAGDDDVVFRDELDDLLVPVGECDAEPVEGASECAGEGWCGDVVEGVGVVAVDDVVDEAPDKGFGVGHEDMGPWAAAVVVVWCTSSLAATVRRTAMTCWSQRVGSVITGS